MHDNLKTTTSVNDSSTSHETDKNNVNDHSLTLDTPNNLNAGFNSSSDSSEENVSTFLRLDRMLLLYLLSCQMRSSFKTTVIIRIKNKTSVWET